ncbi:MAG: acetyl-CoA carboxylase biotin carboxylase subunit [Candidatus Rokuibacteriota bacterium]
MFGKILIANRGEIALRVLRTCRDLGIRTVVAHSRADTNSLPVLLADESVCIGPEESAQSYLNIPSLISAAEVTDAEAVHPGYGFLAENATFAEICRACSIRFIGPSPEAIRLLGDKIRARDLARKCEVPLLPGSEGAVRDEADVRACADEIGYPVLLKAAMGGGGRGMRVVRDPESLAAAVQTCQSEAAAAFGSSEVFLERYVEGARHVEVQVLADGHGQLIHLGERECSIQRRHQKLLEESPSPAVTPAIRAELAAAALRLCRAAGYENAGTVEFVLDGQGRFYFLEVNTRIQVEHPVTEMVTGVDLVREQIRIAAGERLGLGLGQDALTFTGHAIECRITAEDPVSFTPNPGRITAYRPPGGPGVRVDSHCFGGYTVPPHYDSLVAKVIAHGRDRAEAIARMRRALGEFLLEGIKSTIPFHTRLLADPRFLEGAYSTTFLESHV